MPVSSTDVTNRLARIVLESNSEACRGVQTLIELTEEVLQRHPQRCAHLHPAESGKLYRLPYGLWAWLCPACEDEFHSRWPGLESEIEREGRAISRGFEQAQQVKAGCRR